MQDHGTYGYEKVGINQSITRGRHPLVRTAGQTTYLTNQLLKWTALGPPAKPKYA